MNFLKGSRIMKKALAFVFVMLLFAALCVPVFANSPVPPSLAVYVENAPDDLELDLTLSGGRKPDSFSIKKGVYCFYFAKSDGEGAVLRVSTGGSVNTFDVTENMLRNGATLSFGSGAPTLAARPAGTFRNVLFNLAVTLVIEFIVLMLFGYRKGRTFLIFLIANLITQALYNAFLYLAPASLANSFPLLIAIEAVVIIIEGLFYCFKFREHGKFRAWSYAFVANLASMFIGTILTVVYYSMTRPY